MGGVSLYLNNAGKKRGGRPFFCNAVPKWRLRKKRTYDDALAVAAYRIRKDFKRAKKFICHLQPPISFQDPKTLRTEQNANGKTE